MRSDELIYNMFNGIDVYSESYIAKLFSRFGNNAEAEHLKAKRVPVICNGDGTYSIRDNVDLNKLEYEKNKFYTSINHYNKWAQEK